MTSLLVLVQISYAQMLGIRSYRIAEGASNVRINKIIKSFQGYIYTGTSSGLYKFDGIDFTLITSGPGIKDPSITAIFEDKSRRIWAGLQSGDIGILMNSQLNLYRPEEGTPKKPITAFLQDNQDNIWFATDGEGIYYLSKDHLYNINTDDGLSENNVYTLALATNGDVLAGTDQGLSIINISRGKKEIINISSKAGLPDNFIKTIISAGNDQFWIGMQDKGFCLYNHNSRQFEIPSAITGWDHGQVNAMLVAQEKLWIATETEGLLCYTGGNSVLQKIEFAKMPVLNINGMLQDDEGNLWMVSNSNTLVRSAGDRLQVHTSYLPGEWNEIHAILVDHNNVTWTADDSGLTSHLKGADGKMKTTSYGFKGLINKTDITALYEDLYYNIWIGTMGQGIFIFNPSNGRYRHMDENVLQKRGSILSISGRGNNVFVSSLEGATEFTLSAENNNPDSRYKSKDFGNISGIGTNIIYSIYKDRKGRVWFATDGRGVVKYENGKYTSFDERSGLKDKFIYSITEDASGNTWFSTRDAGIYEFDGKKFTNYSIREGLSDVNISAIKRDKIGNIVVIHKKGIDILNPLTGLLTYLGSNQGIGEVNVQDLGSVAKDSSGNIYFSSSEGIIRYTPVSSLVHKPVTIIEDVQLFFSSIKPGDENVFSDDENSFTFSFNGLYLTDPQLVQYQYKLDGYDIKWNITRDKSISFPRLPPGSYSFRVRSSTNSIFKDADEAFYEFSIKPPFYTTWWFILLCITIMSTLIYLYVKTREKSLKKFERLQQEKIQFQFETLRNQVNPHFLFNSFNTLISTIEDDPKLAVEYVEQLSDFFRNIVTYRDKELISLHEEVEVMNTYFYIQQKRFGENLSLVINLDPADKHSIFIPPLTLQLLTENAIKHNAVSKETRLQVEIYLENNRIIVKNNINKLIHQPLSSGMGLQNIINRYSLLSKQAVSVEHTKTLFIVSLPILKTEA
ncbi:MAG: two-component regulator propeller domain-containing protein [Chitinophagaceae bacterium]